MKSQFGPFKSQPQKSAEFPQHGVLSTSRRLWKHKEFNLFERGRHTPFFFLKVRAKVDQKLKKEISYIATLKV